MALPSQERAPLPLHLQFTTSSGLCYDEVIEELVKPLPAYLIKVRPGATTKDKSQALALAYYDWRVMANRLNRVVGRSGWYAHLVPWGESKVICTLTILGVPKDASGEARTEGGKERDNPGTSAEAQAKRRAMAEHGLNYLYFLPQIWGSYDAQKKRLVNPKTLVEEMYRTARIPGIDLKPFLTATTDKAVRPAILSPTKPARDALSMRSPLSEDLRRYIQDVCAVLKCAEPDYTTLDQASGQALLEDRLLPEYRALLARTA